MCILVDSELESYNSSLCGSALLQSTLNSVVFPVEAKFGSNPKTPLFGMLQFYPMRSAVHLFGAPQLCQRLIAC